MELALTIILLFGCFIWWCIKGGGGSDCGGSGGYCDGHHSGSCMYQDHSGKK